MTRWIFTSDGYPHLDVSTPGIDANTKDAVTDFLTTDIGRGIRNIASYRERWKNACEGELNSVLGNGTEQELEGDRVRLESLYEQWETVYFTVPEFEELLDDYAAFVKDAD
ncbi:hypothetical protein [Frankia sp. AgKG'84/4]|uniref:hypothetical protein n=1 Tax=Frankia sp. AgKG'84/4 TaxID=573490 RepID=UPI00200DC107|nr:hypothetical protein [Frankia sp. AgKG'84/4]MCL9795199.1 hypothetical protein [Frankia sp. AgKG'84/4]